MPTTKQIPSDQLATYFDTFTKRFLRHGAPEAADVEILINDLGDQFASEGTRLLGITYQARTRDLEFELDGADHRIQNPREIWAIEDPDGFVQTIEIVTSDGTKQIVNIKKVGLQKLG
jgi:hypothetical protein